MKRGSDLLALASIAAMSAALIGHALQSSPSTDDFCNHLIATSLSLPSAVLAAYNDWTGRVVTSVLLYATLAAVDLFELRHVGAALAILFILASHQVARLATIGYSALLVPVTAVAMAAMMIGLYPLTGQTVFWITGGIVYTVPLALLLRWLVSMRRLFLTGDDGFGSASGFVYGVIVGNAIELVVPLALVYGGSMLVLRRAELPASARRVALWRLSGVIVGALVLAMAPGNLKRASATAGSLGADPSILGQELVRMMTTTLEAGGPLLAGLVLVTLVAAIAARSHAGDNMTQLTRQASEPIVLAVSATATLLPLLLAPAQFTPRNLYFALVTLLVAAFVFAIPPLSRVLRLSTILSIIALAGTLGAMVVYSRNIEEAGAIRKLLMEQDRRLRDAGPAGVSDVVLPPIGIVPPPTVHFIELSTDASRWDNRCVARYYGVESVRIGVEAR